MLRAKTFLSKKSVKILICCLIAVIVSLCVLGFNVSSSSSTTTDPQFKFKAKITGSVCEIWGTSPVKEEGKQVSMLAVANHKPEEFSSLSNTEFSNNIAYIDQFETGKNGSFYMTLKLINADRISYEKGKTKIYIIMNSEECNVSNYLEVDVLPVNGSVSGISSASMRVGLDVYELGSPLITEDNILDSIKRGGNEMWFKLGSNWYDLLDDKCTDSNYLQSKNAISQSDVNNRLWSRYYKNGETSPSYFQ